MLKPNKLVCSVALSLLLLIGTASAGETGVMPLTPPPTPTTVKAIHSKNTGRSLPQPSVFDLIKIVLSNLGLSLLSQ